MRIADHEQDKIGGGSTKDYVPILLEVIENEGYVLTLAPNTKEPADSAQQPVKEICSIHVCDYCTHECIRHGRHCENHNFFRGRKLHLPA